MTVQATGVVHLAGPVLGARQECARCGAVLSQYTGAEAFQLADLPDPGDATTAYTFWPVGRGVLAYGNAKMAVDSLLPGRDTADEIDCEGPHDGDDR